MKPLGVLVCLLLVPVAALGQPQGVLPVGTDGKALNLDFETGTLKDWTAEGEAFKDQPIEGDTVHPRRGDMHSRHQANYWIGGYEKVGDKPQGTLTSVPFKVTHPWASFLVGGGPHETTCVELVKNADKTIIFRATGVEAEDMRRVVVDLKGLMGQQIFIRIVDRHSGHWGHVNFDDFRFHAEKPDFPMPKGIAPPDVYKYAGLPPEKAAKVMTVPEGFEVKLFAGEPDVVQPIAMCLDDRGRVWVAEGRCYPIRRNAKDANDRILIFEDTDGDGHFDKRTVFMEGLNLVSGLEVGFGGVWIGAAPHLLYVPMKEVSRSGDRATTTVPAGKPQVLLDGWGWQDTHETLNSFIWGPDGWLYGCHGVFTHSNVGKPGTPDDQRTKINAGIWRYHPTRHVFEVFAHGTSNPWGIDFDEHGQAFVECCVIPHCFHIIQGGRYQRQAGEHFNNYTYADIQTIADHLHWQGANPWAGNNRSDSMGGGHAHAGLMCYQGGAWPEKYRGQLFMGNIHGRRLNTDIPRPKGSGYVAGHGPDFLMANDAWARFINMRYGPDGNVYVIDWYDKQACHVGSDVKAWDRSNGRIYKVCYRGTKWEPVDLGKMATKELVDLQANDNEWYVRHARRLLQERAASRPDNANVDDKANPPAGPTTTKRDIEALELQAVTHKNARNRLRGLWALNAIGGLDWDRVNEVLKDKDPHVRGWAIQLALEQPIKEWIRIDQLVKLAEKDDSPIVRLHLASALQRLDYEDRQRLLEHLLRNDDSKDPNLPLMYWYGLEPLAGNVDHRADALRLAADSPMEMILAFTVRRIASDAAPASLDLILSYLGEKDVNAGVILRELRNALKGRPQVAMPKAWPAAFAKLAATKDAAVREQAAALAVTFGDVRAFDQMRQLVTTATTDAATRQGALSALLAAKDKRLVPVLHKLLGDPAMRGAALKGLANYDDPQTPAAIIGVYGKLDVAEKRDALATLASRPTYARAMLDAVADKKIAAADVSADIVRNLRNLKDAALTKRINEVWGIVRDTPLERATEIMRYTRLVRDGAPRAADVALGRAIFAKTCQQCHTLFGVGGKVGPDITGANRSDLKYLLENILDPSAVIPKEYAATIIATKAGRVVTGIVKGETPAALTVVTANETLTIPMDDIDSRQPTKVSMMPDDQLKPMSDLEVRSLIAYLQSPTQTPLLATPENAKDLFNGKDLTGWDGDAKLWRVENGEIIGKSPGLKHNSFLRSQMVAANFKFTVKVKLVPNKENSGIQFRSEALPHYECKGYQADVGAGWWGKLYEEQGRGLLSDKGGEKFVKVDDWNTYVIEAKGSRIRTCINGELCVDLEDAKGARRGIFALQIHAGGPMEVRFKELRLEVLP